MKRATQLTKGESESKGGKTLDSLTANFNDYKQNGFGKRKVLKNFKIRI